MREELLGVNGEYGERPGTDNVPCPFATALLGTSYDTDLDPSTFYTSGVAFENSVIAAQIGCWSGGT